MWTRKETSTLLFLPFPHPESLWVLDNSLAFSSCYRVSRLGNTFVEVIIWFTFQKNNKELSFIPFLKSHWHGAIKVTHSLLCSNYKHQWASLLGIQRIAPCGWARHIVSRINQVCWMLCFYRDNISSDYSSLGLCTDRQNANSHFNHSLAGTITLKGTERVQPIKWNWAHERY